MKSEWVKLIRSRLPQDKGVMGAPMKLSTRAAFVKAMLLQLETAVYLIVFCLQDAF